jgi:hypothetical protein
MTYDRLLRWSLSESNRFVGLHDDSHRLLFIALLWRANDFGCLECDTESMTRWVSTFTQIKTPLAFLAAITALADCDLVRRYEAEERTFLFIPRFRSARSYTTRAGIPPSPWCKPNAPTGRIRVLAKPFVQGKPLTNDMVSATLRQPSANPMSVSANKHEEMADLFAEQPKVSGQLAGGVGEKKEKKDARSAGRGTRLPDGWTIPPGWTDWTIAHAAGRSVAVSAEDVRRLSEQFRDWALSIGTVRKDWLATWRTWVRRENLQKWATKAQDDDLNRWT